MEKSPEILSETDFWPEPGSALACVLRSVFWLVPGSKYPDCEAEPSLPRVGRFWRRMPEVDFWLVRQVLPGSEHPDREAQPAGDPGDEAQGRGPSPRIGTSSGSAADPDSA